MLFAFALAAQVAASSGEAAQRREEPSYRIEQAPARLAAGVEIADVAIRALQQRLSARLQEELQKGGPARAVGVCRDEAQALTAETARIQGVQVGRSSHRLRNPGNAAPPWAERFVAAGAGRKAASVEAVVVDLGDRVGVLRPIPTAAACTQCHGPAERLSPDVRAFLETAYPQDRAKGFEEGDLRGFIWAEAPVNTVATSSKAPIGRGAGDPARGRELFGEANPRCTLCHAVAGKGNPQGPPLDGVGQRLSREEIKAWIRTPAEMAKKRGTSRKPAMLPYPEFSDEELDALVAYLAGLGPSPERK
jgi:mono/diheme cytochrome c family protein